MRRYALTIVLVIIIGSCSSFNKSEIVIKTKTDTISFGETYNAELYVPYHENFLPKFYIIRGEDTARLPIDTIKRCAVFNAAGRSSGEKIYEGYVDYINIKGENRNEKFAIKYFVKPK
jgi:hypothetical protein